MTVSGVQVGIGALISRKVLSQEPAMCKEKGVIRDCRDHGQKGKFQAVPNFRVSRMGSVRSTICVYLCASVVPFHKIPIRKKVIRPQRNTDEHGSLGRVQCL